MISKLIRNFNSKHEFSLFGIGSGNLNKLTLKQITLKRIFNQKIEPIEDRALKKVITKDN